MSEAGTRLVGRASAKLAAARYTVDIQAGHHELIGDEPVSGGGGDAGPSPFGFVLAGLGACTAITLRMYAERKELAADRPCASISNIFATARHFRIERVLHIEGALDETQRARLADIAERTPVTLALKAGATINTRLG